MQRRVFMEQRAKTREVPGMAHRPKSLNRTPETLRFPIELGRAVTDFLGSGLRIENQLSSLHRDFGWHRNPNAAVLSDTGSL